MILQINSLIRYILLVLFLFSIFLTDNFAQSYNKFDRPIYRHKWRLISGMGFFTDGSKMFICHKQIQKNSFGFDYPNLEGNPSLINISFDTSGYQILYFHGFEKKGDTSNAFKIINENLISFPPNEVDSSVLFLENDDTLILLRQGLNRYKNIESIFLEFFVPNTSNSPPVPYIETKYYISYLNNRYNNKYIFVIE